MRFAYCTLRFCAPGAQSPGVRSLCSPPHLFAKRRSPRFGRRCRRGGPSAGGAQIRCAGVVNLGSQCMHAVHDSGAGFRYSPRASEMGRRFACSAASQRRSRGPRVRYLGRLADRPSERRLRGRACGEVDLRDLPGRWLAFQAPGDGSEAAEQGVLRAPTGVWSVAIGREPGRPAPPPSPRAVVRCGAVRVGEMVSGEVVRFGVCRW
jgi:hypothetical protein